MFITCVYIFDETLINYISYHLSINPMSMTLLIQGHIWNLKIMRLNILLLICTTYVYVNFPSVVVFLSVPFIPGFLILNWINAFRLLDWRRLFLSLYIIIVVSIPKHYKTCLYAKPMGNKTQGINNLNLN